MITFGSAKVVGNSTVNLIVTHAPGSRALSLITERAQCRDRTDSDARFTAFSFNVKVEVLGDGSATLTLDVRGSEVRSDEHAFAVLRIGAGGLRRTLLGNDQSGEIYERITLDVEAPLLLTVSVLLLANGGEDPSGESLISIDSLDLATAA